MEFKQIIIAALTVEALINILKPLWDRSKPFDINYLIPIPIGVLIAVAAQIDWFATAGIPLFIPYLGSVLTGIIISRGANIVFDLVKLLNETKKYIASKLL